MTRTDLHSVEVGEAVPFLWPFTAILLHGFGLHMNSLGTPRHNFCEPWFDALLHHARRHLAPQFDEVTAVGPHWRAEEQGAVQIDNIAALWVRFVFEHLEIFNIAAPLVDDAAADGHVGCERRFRLAHENVEVYKNGLGAVAKALGDRRQLRKEISEKRSDVLRHDSCIVFARVHAHAVVEERDAGVRLFAHVVLDACREGPKVAPRQATCSSLQNEELNNKLVLIGHGR